MNNEIVVFNTHMGKKIIPKADVAFVKADNKYLDFYTEQGVFTESESLTRLASQWGDEWVLVRNNALVRKSAITSFVSVDRKLTVQCNGQHHTLDVGRRRVAELRRWLKTCKPVAQVVGD